MHTTGGVVLAFISFLPAPALAQAAADRQAGPGHVLVYVHNLDVPYPVQDLAQLVAERIFKKIGITIDWRCGKIPRSLRERPIVIELSIAPKKGDSNAVGYALPYEGVHIRVFYGRIEREPNRATVLAYVFVHEITHILQGVVRHSDTGIMKARWTNADIDLMSYKDLPFTPVDVLLIQKGLVARTESKNNAFFEDPAEEAVDSH